MFKSQIIAANSDYSFYLFLDKTWMPEKVTIILNRNQRGVNSLIIHFPFLVFLAIIEKMEKKEAVSFSIPGTKAFQIFSFNFSDSNKSSFILQFEDETRNSYRLTLSPAELDELVVNLKNFSSSFSLDLKGDNKDKIPVLIKDNPHGIELSAFCQNQTRVKVISKLLSLRLSEVKFDGNSLYSGSFLNSGIFTSESHLKEMINWGEDFSKLFFNTVKNENFSIETSKNFNLKISIEPKITSEIRISSKAQLEDLMDFSSLILQFYTQPLDFDDNYQKTLDKF